MFCFSVLHVVGYEFLSQGAALDWLRSGPQIRLGGLLNFKSQLATIEIKQHHQIKFVFVDTDVLWFWNSDCR